MIKRYLVVSSGLSKEKGTPYALTQAIIKHDKGEFLGDKFVLDEIRPVGQIIEVEQTLVTTNTPKV